MEWLDGGRTALITRSEWRARRPRYTTPLTPSFGSTAHWEGPHMGEFEHEACFSKVRGIQNFHMDTRGWADIAYTAVVCPHGWVFEGRWIGNRTGANGTNQGNGTAYAVCYLGGEGDPYTEAGERGMHDTFIHLRKHGRAGAGVNCHSDWKPTACPGGTICGLVKAGRFSGDVPPGEPTPEPTPPVPPVSYEPRMLQEGMTGNDVKVWQTLMRVPADGIFGPQTKAATIKFQENMGLTPDGIVGPQTAQAMRDLLAYLSAISQRAQLQLGSRGGDVQYLQSRLSIRSDGIFGPLTRSAVIAFQRRHGLTADGIVGPKTWAALG